MRKLLILFFLITLSCSTSNTENNVVLNESVELSTPTPEVDEVLEVKKNDGEIKYNHPKIKNDKEEALELLIRLGKSRGLKTINLKQ